jgi:hypothetical protein
VGTAPFSFNQKADFTPVYPTCFDAALARPLFFPAKMKPILEWKAFMQSRRGSIVAVVRQLVV